MLIKPVDFLQRSAHIQCVTLRFRLRIRADKQSLPRSQGSPLIGAQLGALAATLPLCIHQVPAVELRPAVFRGEFDMLLAALILHPQLVVRRGAQHVAGVIVTGDVVRVLRVVQRIRNVRQVDIAVAVRNRHFGAIDERRMPAQRFTGIRFRHPQPQVTVSGFRPLPVEVRLHPVAPLLVQVRVDIILLPALNPGRKRAVNFRTRDFRRAETVPFGVRLAPD